MKIVCSLAVALFALVSWAENITLGNGALYEAGGSSDNIAIGTGALSFASNVVGTVAIGNGELRGMHYNSHTTSINGEQIWFSQPANAFSLNPKKNDAFTNSPIWYANGELHLNASNVVDRNGNEFSGSFIDFSSAQIKLGTYEIDGEYTNGTYISSPRLTIQNPKLDFLFSAGVETGIVFSCHIEGELWYKTAVRDWYSIYHNTDISIAIEIFTFEGVKYVKYGHWKKQFTQSGAPYEFIYVDTTVSEVTDFTVSIGIDCNHNFGDYLYGQPKVFTGLSNRKNKRRKIEFAADEVLAEKTNVVVSSAGIYNFVLGTTGGASFKFENGEFAVYTNGVKAGTLQFTPTP